MKNIAKSGSADNWFIKNVTICSNLYQNVILRAYSVEVERKSVAKGSEKMLQAIFWVMLIFLVVGGIWSLVEKLIYGQITPRILDDIICLVLSISLYYNIFK
ncbi:hypothetical protein G6554_22575 [Bacillus sp. MM2020_4]|nr:hypothetical protein [Bacillus sp. MM2020_4]